MVRTLSLAALVLPAALVAACADDPAPEGGDPALAALQACVADAPGALCARPAVPTPSGRALVGAGYWRGRATGDPAAFADAVAVCARAGVEGHAVGTVRAVRAADRALAREKVEGRAPLDAALDPGVCHDVYLVYAETRAAGGALPAGPLSDEETAFSAEQGRQARDRSAPDALRGRGNAP